MRAKVRSAFLKSQPSSIVNLSSLHYESQPVDASGSVSCPPPRDLQYDTESNVQKSVTLSLSDLVALQDSPTFRPPPGLSLVEPADQLKVVEPPPGLLPCTDEKCEPPPGLFPFTDEKGIDSDDTSAGGLENEDSVESSEQSDGEQSSGGLVLAEVSQLKADSTMFRPRLSPGAAKEALSLSILVPESVDKKPLRTKLRSKATLFVPSAAASTYVPPAAAAVSATCTLPYVPMATVNKCWQQWHMRMAMALDSSEDVP